MSQFIDLRHKHLIIGAGPVGLAVAKAFGEESIPYLQLEASDTVGGNWAHGVYETAHIISSRKTTEYPDWPMPEHYPDFPSAQQMRQYFLDYAETFHLRDNLEFGALVEKVAQRDDESWEVHASNGKCYLFKGVIVCNGHHWSKAFPPWAKDFSGEVLHSKDYKRPEQLAGRRVLVVGGGNSGCDLVSEAARVASVADWSLRRGYWFLPKTFFGRPSVELLQPWMPLDAQRVLIRGLLRVVVGRYEDYGLPVPDHEIFEAHPTISTEVFHYLKHGKIVPRGDVSRIDGKSVTFTDGSKGDYDLLVCATGFDVAFPFLPEGMVPVKGKVAQLVGGMLRPQHRHLYVMGTGQARYGIGPLLRPLALMLADWIRFQDELSVPLGQLLAALGARPPRSHLVGPHEAMRAMNIARAMVPVFRFQASQRGLLRPGLPRFVSPFAKRRAAAREAGSSSSQAA